jgi:hypothetical protein
MLGEVIEVEVARRLFFDHKFTFAQMDKTKLFKLPTHKKADRDIITLITARLEAQPIAT